MKHFDFTVLGTAASVCVLKVNTMPECGRSCPVFEGSVNDFQNGGMGFNIVAGLSNLGCSVYPVLTYADYRQHDFLHGFFKNYDLPQDGLSDPPKDSAGTTIMIQNAEKNHMTLITEYEHRLPTSDYFKKQVMEDKFFDSDYVILTAPLPINTENAIDAIIKSGKQFVLSMRRDEKAFPKNLLIKALFNANYIFANETETQYIISEFGLSGLEELFIKGKLKYFIETVGKEGSVIYSLIDGKLSKQHVPIVSCQNPIVDSVGAGDGYVSGFMYGLSKGFSVYQCGLLGSTVSSFVLEAEGGIVNLPDEKSLLERFKNIKIGEKNGI